MSYVGEFSNTRIVLDNGYELVTLNLDEDWTEEKLAAQRTWMSNNPQGWFGVKTTGGTLHIVPVSRTVAIEQG